MYNATQGGTVVTLSDRTVNATLCVIYSALSGPTIEPGQDLEAWPDWRPLAAGEIDSACDTYNWAMRTFAAAAQVIDGVSDPFATTAQSDLGYGSLPYGEDPYGDPETQSVASTSEYMAKLSATKQQAAIVYNIDNQRQWIMRSVQLQPLSQSGAFQYTDCTPAPALSCDAQGDIVITFVETPTAGTTYQFGVASINDTYNAGDYTVWSFEASANAGNSSGEIKTGTLELQGNATAYMWNDSPHSGPVASYTKFNANDPAWKNQSGAAVLSTSGSGYVGQASGNSLLFDTSKGSPSSGPIWVTLDSGGAQTGSTNPFPSVTENFNMVLAGTLLVPAAGTYDISFDRVNGCIAGIGAGVNGGTATWDGKGSCTGDMGQTITAMNGYPLLPLPAPSTEKATCQVTFSAAGAYPIEIGWDYWYHSGRTLQVRCGGHDIVPSSGTTTASGNGLEIQLFIDTTEQQPYVADNRYIYTASANGGQRYDIHLHATDFLNGSGESLPIGSTIYTCGVMIPGMGMPAGSSLTIYGVQQYPNIAVKYEGGAIPFTANFLGNPASLIGWRGPVCAGYQSPWSVKQLGDETNVATSVQMLADSQAAWKAQSATKDLGPFCPVFYFDKPDSVQYGKADTWGWVGPDPNTGWCGYEYRPLAELAELIAACTGSESYYSQAETIATNFLSWIDAQWTNAISGPPTDFPQTGAKTNYPEPHAAALILRGVLLLDQVARPSGTGTMNATYQSLLNKTITFWTSLYNGCIGTEMEGTFCSNPTGAQDWYGFWQGEILRTLSNLYTWASRTGNSSLQTQAATWIDGLVSFALNSVKAVSTDLGYTVEDFRAGLKWSPKLPKHQLFNGVKGTYICPSNRWQQSDIPPYAQDQLHGYTNGLAAYSYDLNYQQDGARLWKDIQLPFTASVSMAQRIAKIELMRCRQQGRSSLSGLMTMYQSTPLDTVYLSYKPFGWQNKIVEIANSRLVFEKVSGPDGDVPLMGIELDIQETDSSVYDWSTTEELSAQGQSYISSLQSLSPDA